jgi:hypothetical protein
MPVGIFFVNYGIRFEYLLPIFELTYYLYKKNTVFFLKNMRFEMFVKLNKYII